MQPLIPEKGLFPTLVFNPDVQSAKKLAGDLGRLEFPSYAVSSGRDAVRCLEEAYFRVAVVIAELSNADCLRFLDSVRRVAPRTWLLVACRVNDHATQQIAYRHGADGVIEAPVDALTLVERLAPMQAKSRPTY